MPNQQTLLLEIGNSSIKVAHLDDGGGLRLERYSNVEALLRRCEGWMGRIICAPVGAEASAEVLERIGDARDLVVLERSMFDAFIADSYDTPGTLGLDRILNLLGVEGDGVVISCGTAITVDAVVAGRPRWGAIMPGFRTAAEGLHARIPALPLVELDEGTGLPARSSRRSVANGVILGTALAAQALARTLASSSRIIITGGDAELLARLWEGEVEIDEVLLFRGMVRWVMVDGR